MRMKSLLTALIAVASLSLASPKPADAGFDGARPDGYDHVRTVRHWVYYPRYAHVFQTRSDTDPYAYRFEPRGYYPYYNSGYWVPAREYRRPKYTYKIPRYYKAWGYPKAGYDNVEWHNRKYGRIRHSHW